MENEGAREYSIGELAEEAGVSTRTIRYYVSEGLLPPPVGAGPNSRYTDAHLSQLGIIGRLKEQYLPLREIRRRLIGHEISRRPRLPRRYHPSTTVPAGEIGKSPRTARSTGCRRPRRTSCPTRGRRRSSGTIPSPKPTSPPEREQAWRRVSISDEAELLITEDPPCPLDQPVDLVLVSPVLLLGDQQLGLVRDADSPPRLPVLRRRG